LGFIYKYFMNKNREKYLKMPQKLDIVLKHIE